MNPLLLNELAGRTWLMNRSHLESVLRAARAGATVPTSAARSSTSLRSGNVAIIPIQGVIDRRDSFFLQIFGGTSIDSIRAGLRDALVDPSVSGIVFLVHSPGGVVDGTPELADEIFKSRGKKPMVAVVDTMCCSAAFWLASQADEILVPKYSSDTGSVGCYCEHISYEKALEREGIAVSLIAAGEGKTAGNPYEDLSDEDRAEMQKGVDEVYGFFVDAVARGRDVKASTIRSEWGARVYGSKDAIRLGMANRIGSLDDAVSRVTSGKVGRKASADTTVVVSLDGLEVARVAADVADAAAIPDDSVMDETAVAVQEAATAETDEAWDDYVATAIARGDR